MADRNVAGEDLPPGRGEVVGPVDGGASPDISRARRSTGTKIRLRGGVRTMKSYILTEGDLQLLGGLRTAATVCFSLATLAFGFWLSITQAFGFSEHLAPIVRATWSAWQKVTFALAIILAAAGVGLMWWGRTYLATVKREMKHDD
jgi:hypothetical protein